MAPHCPVRIDFRSSPTRANPKYSGADVFITGEVKYHDYFSYENSILVAEIGHYESEQYTKEIFYSIIREMFPSLSVSMTSVNTNPIKYL